MASCVHNGNNETKIGLSHSMAITFSNNNGDEIEIAESAKFIEIWIPRDLNQPTVNPYYVNISKQANNNNDSDSHLFPIGLNVTTLNSSIHVEISPLNFSIGYLVMLKFNMTPKINSTFKDYDHWNMFCPFGNYIF